MKEVSHYEKVMWGLYCEYSWIPSDVWYEKKWKWGYAWNEEEARNTYQALHQYEVECTKRSAAEWSFIHSKYYHITKIDSIYAGTLEDFIEYLKPVENTRWKNPYNYKKNGYGFRWANRCGKNRYRWRYTNGVRTKDQKKLPHIKKKTLSIEEINKREWKEKVNKEKRKPNWSYKRKKDCISKGNRAERRHVKSTLQSGDWSGSQLRWWTHDEDERAWECHLVVSDWDSYQDRDKRYWASSWDWD